MFAELLDRIEYTSGKSCERTTPWVSSFFSRSSNGSQCSKLLPHASLAAVWLRFIKTECLARGDTTVYLQNISKFWGPYQKSLLSLDEVICLTKFHWSYLGLSVLIGRSSCAPRIVITAQSAGNIRAWKWRIKSSSFISFRFPPPHPHSSSILRTVNWLVTEPEVSTPLIEEEGGNYISFNETQQPAVGLGPKLLIQSNLRRHCSSP